MGKKGFALQSDETLLEILITTAFNRGGCKLIEFMAVKLIEQFPEQTGVRFEDLIKEAKFVESLIPKEFLDSCKAEILQRMKRGQITA